MPRVELDYENLQKEQQKDQAAEEYAFTSRRHKHPSNKGKYIRLYYLTLVLVFLALTVSLMMWGKSL